MAILKLSPSSSDPQFAAERKLDGPAVAMQPSSPLPRLPFDPLWTPEQVARVKKSYTGQALAHYFQANGSRRQTKVD